MNLYTIARKKETGAIIWSEDQKQYIVHKYVQEDKTLKEISLEF
jgi:transposase-like protein